MPPRNQNSQIIVVDVGAKMHVQLASVARALSGHIVSKMVNSPAHQVGLILYGTTGTRNSVHLTEVEDEEQYVCIEEAWELQVPTKDHLCLLRSLPEGEGRTDVCEALVVAIHMYENSQAAQVKANSSQASILLISNFLSEPVELDQEYLGMLAEKMRASSLSLEVICVDGEGEVARPGNLAAVDYLQSELGGSGLRRTKNTAELVACFRAKEVAPTTIYRGPMTFTSELYIPVWVYKKTMEAKLPSTKIFSDSRPLDDPQASHEVKMETVYKDPSDHTREVPAQERVRAYPYGRQMVPVDATTEGYLKFHAEKGFRIIGFVPRQEVPRHHFMQDTSVVTPEASSVKAALAMASLVKAMVRLDQVAIARAVWRNNATSVVLGVLSPHPGNLLHADCLLFNVLPFLEDARMITCPTFDDDKVRPQTEQFKAAEAMIQSMNLDESTGTFPSTDTIANPTIAYFNQVLAGALCGVDPQGAEALLETMLQPPKHFSICPKLQEAGKVLSKWISDTDGAASAKPSAQNIFLDGSAGGGEGGHGVGLQEAKPLVYLNEWDSTRTLHRPPPWAVVSLSSLADSQ
mmetsp:Transcript_29073/g.81935  ORF Transcript_29073/g.81935 Transcript_29073/m.81935 type:complete len:577 (+) Transcript_29073:334-2064(+)